MGAHREVRQLAEIATGITADLAVAAVVLQVDQHHAEGGDDLLAPDEEVQPVGDLQGVATVGVRQSLFDALEALPAVEVLVEVEMLVDLGGAVAIEVAQAHQLAGRRMGAGVFAPGAVEAAVEELGLDRGQLVAGKRLAEQVDAAFRLAGHAPEHGGEGGIGDVQHQAYRDRAAVLLFEEVHQVQAVAHRGGAVGRLAAGAAVGQRPAELVGAEAVLDLPAIGEMQGQGLADEVRQVGQDEGLGGETIGQGADGDPFGLGGHVASPLGWDGAMVGGMAQGRYQPEGGVLVSDGSTSAWS
ncbi:hypothetical protein FQZ97_749130 [compost metagenome]